MYAALLVARLLLALVFALAGVAKLVDRAGARRAIIDFGGTARQRGQGGLRAGSGRTGGLGAG